MRRLTLIIPNNAASSCSRAASSGQSVVYLLSLNQDASLRYQEVYKDNCCFLDYAFEANPDEGAKSGIGSNERSKARASFVDAFRKVGALLDCAGKPESSSEELEETDDFGALQLFQVGLSFFSFLDNHLFRSFVNSHSSRFHCAPSPCLLGRIKWKSKKTQLFLSTFPSLHVGVHRCYGVLP